MRKALLCLAFLFASCASDTTEPEAFDAPTETDPSTAEETDEESDDAMTKPDIQVPDGAPPRDLKIKDIDVGSGDEVQEGATITIHYVGVAWSTGEEFDSSWEGEEPATFPLDNLIEGWQEGIPGMKEGGRRQLIVPPDLAYGDQPPPGIEPGETLIFVIDLIDADAS